MITLKNEIDSHFILKVFDKIRQHGEHKDDAYHLANLKAYTDFDGYTVFIEDARVKLRFGFHNQYHFDYDNAQSLEAFERKMQSVMSEY